MVLQLWFLTHTTIMLRLMRGIFIDEFTLYRPYTHTVLLNPQWVQTYMG